MLFNSYAFALFLPIVFGAYWLFPHKFRWIILLVSSCYFYMNWNAKYIVLIMITTFISYVNALLIEQFREKKKVFLIISTSASLGILFFFKYFNFLSGTVIEILKPFSSAVHPVTLKVILPIGISFYTFQTVSYTADVYKGSVKAEKHFGKYAAFITFFPQLVAGPIERTNNLLPQIHEKHTFQYAQAVYGMRLMAWGFFKKIVIADNLAAYVDLIYGNVYTYKGFSLVIASIFFAFQIYCDFSGYSDIAVGVAKLFGIDLMMNFNSPYFSSSIKEFWSRWHISLSTWFRDYVYIPLGGNRKGRCRTRINLMITFLTSGLWHGANWTFVLWGGVHGIVQILENLRGAEKQEKSLYRRLLSIGITFLSVCFCWVIFRAGTIQESIYVFMHMFDGVGKIGEYILLGYHDLGLGRKDMLVLPMSLSILLAYDYVSLKYDVLFCFGRLPGVIRWSIYYFLVFLIVLAGNFGSSQFVYFQF